LELTNWSGKEYAYFKGSPGNATTASFDIEIIRPASAKQIQRYRQPTYMMVCETASAYEEVTAPVAAAQASEKALGWLWNIVKGEKETERVLVSVEGQEKGFLLCVDTKWRDHPPMKDFPVEQSLPHRVDLRGHPSTSNLYCLAIARAPITSIRELRGEHLPLLRSIRDEGFKAIERTYGVHAHELRVFLHYQPQFYQLHVHFTRHFFVNPGVEVDRAHMLDVVISNIEVNSEYYKTATLCYKLRKGEPLHKAFAEKWNQETPPGRQ
jgi:m7GpppX diphosphatase